MIVYGDRSEQAEPGAALLDLGTRIDEIALMPPGVERHGALTSVFVRLGQIVQGLADADREITGCDGISAAEQALMPSLMDLARALITSWESDFKRIGQLPSLDVPTDLPAEIELRVPEGYAFYGLYPEQFLTAARRLRLGGNIQVIGLRSIGTGLAAVVATALDAPAPLIVRPVAHPFERRIEIAPEAAEALLASDAIYLIVDEGPGLSGSSFVAVLNWLEARGVPASRIIFLPSHAGGPGDQARPGIRLRWAEARVEVVDADQVISPARIASWVSFLIGPLDGPLEDISGGAWRSRIDPSDTKWPAVNPNQERRKFLANAGGKTWLVKFAGLGDEGERKLARAMSLSNWGLTPPVQGLVHGYLVEQWLEGKRLTPGATGTIPQIARYLAARARLLSAAGNGASLEHLFEMARFNIGIELGEKAAAALVRPERHLQAQVHPMAIDGRCDPHEWLQLPDGSVLKTDALDHDAAHDLIGAQDLAWDVAGVSIEFDFYPRLQQRLLRLVDEAAPRPVSRDLLRFLTPCYLAFRLGSARLAEASLSQWPQEAARNAAAAEAYAARLDALLSRGMTEAA